MGERRYRFGQVMSALVELESRLADFYSNSAQHIRHEDIKNLFLSFANRSEKHKSDLTRIRQETIVEMAIEPITMEFDGYSKRATSILSDEKLPDLQKAVKLENLLHELYRKSAAKVASTSADAGSLLEKFSEESSRRVKRIESIG